MGGAVILSAILKKRLSKVVVDIESTLAILRIPTPSLESVTICLFSVGL